MFLNEIHIAGKCSLVATVAFYKHSKHWNLISACCCTCYTISILVPVLQSNLT